jgi:formate/nitrite transporter FocA (FNT family)
MGINFNSPMVDKIRTVSEAKTIFYQNLGLSGWALAFIKGILCNWMVTLGTVLAFTSKSTIGKISAMGLPIIVFFTQGFEHAVVNMFVIPTGILLGSNATISGWLLFNQLPVTIGNFIGGCLLTGVSFYVMFREKEKNTKTMA